MEVQPTTKILSRSFSPAEFVAMFKDDPLSKSGRYDDICGSDAASVLKRVGWSYAVMPLTIGVQLAEQTIAVAFATPIVLDATRNAGGMQVDGINLSYTVHSEHEGKGFGLKASCLAILEAERLWGPVLQNGFLNIQTRAANVRSNRLAQLLKAHTSADTGFSATLQDGSKVDYTGYRASWKDAVKLAKNLMIPVAAPVPRKIIPKKDEAELMVFYALYNIPERSRQIHSAKNQGASYRSMVPNHGGISDSRIGQIGAKIERQWNHYCKHQSKVALQLDDDIPTDKLLALAVTMLKKTTRFKVPLKEIADELSEKNLWLGMSEAEMASWSSPPPLIQSPDFAAMLKDDPLIFKRPIPKMIDDAELLAFFDKCSIPERWRQAYSARNSGETLASIGQTHDAGSQLVSTWLRKTENQWGLYRARRDLTILVGDPEYLEQPFEYIIDVSVRPQNCIKQEDIYSIGQLLRTSEEELKKTSNMGAVSLNEIITELAKHGLWLGMTEAEITDWNQPRGVDEIEAVETPKC
jgi:hypothetical protein